MTTLDTLRTAVYVIAAPDPGSGTAPPGASQFLTVLGWAKWLCAGVAVLGLMIVGAMMAVAHRRGTGGEHGSALAWVLGGSITIGSAAALITAMGI